MESRIWFKALCTGSLAIHLEFKGLQGPGTGQETTVFLCFTMHKIRWINGIYELFCSIVKMCYCWVFVLNLDMDEVNTNNNCLLLYSGFKIEKKIKFLSCASNSTITSAILTGEKAALVLISSGLAAMCESFRFNIGFSKVFHWPDRYHSCSLLSG